MHVMVVVGLVALCVYLFSAYAYGATTVLAVRQMPIWSGSKPGGTTRGGLDRVTLTLCAMSTIWFVVLATIEFRLLISGPRWSSLLEVFGLTLSFAYPPLIMHTVFNENDLRSSGRRVAPWLWILRGMYVISSATGVYITAAIFQLVPRPAPLGPWIGMSIGSLFTVCSVYCIALMAGAPPKPAPAQRALRRTMFGLFLIMIPLFFALMMMGDGQLVGEIVVRTVRGLPILFLIASVYFENRFEFYDLIVKRAALLVVNIVVLGVFLALALTSLDRLPAGAARPWLFAVALLPLAMTLPWLHGKLSGWLDRMWFGREFTTVEAVKQVLSAMQPATDEAALIAASEARLGEMFRARIHLAVDGTPPVPPECIEAEIESTLPSGAHLKAIVECGASSRPLLSEDLALLRSLAGVFGFMLENVRLQRRRQEQDQIARELRLQTSRSELKALRAQINPHFLFNALNAIASLIHTDPARADAAVEQLAEVFRYTLRRSEQEWAPLDQELMFAKAYLDVEQARFGPRLSVSVDADGGLNGAQVPSMLLQTLVENAVKHGISQMRGPGRIDITARSSGGDLVLEVRDTGPGPSAPSSADGEHFGLRSVRDRLQGHFGGRASLELVRDDAGRMTVARIRMPLVSEPSYSRPRA